MSLDLVDLRLVQNIADAQSITHGAARSGLSLAAASERLRNMELELRTTLFERQRRGVQPTPAGAALIHHARLVMRQMETMRGDLGGFAKGVRGTVRVLSNTAALQEFLPSALGPFLARHPMVDVAAELETFPFAEDRLVLATPPRHELAGKRTVRFADALAYDFVGLSEGSALQEHLEGHAARAGQALRLRVRLPGFDAVCRMVESGIGVAVVSRSAALRNRKAMAIRVVPLSDAWARRRLRICVKSIAALPVHA